MGKKNIQHLTWEELIAGFKEAGAILRTLSEDHSDYQFLYRGLNGDHLVYPLPEHFDAESRVTIGQVMNACRLLRLDHQDVFPEHVINF